jgi:hypothetical protein
VIDDVREKVIRSPGIYGLSSYNECAARIAKLAKKEEIPVHNFYL